MFDPDQNDEGKRGRSLPGLGNEAAPARAARPSSSLLSVAADEAREDALERHRRARLRREAAARTTAAEEPPAVAPETASPVARPVPDQPEVSPSKPARPRWSPSGWLSSRPAAPQPVPETRLAAAPVEPVRERADSYATAAVPAASPATDQDLYWKPLIDPMVVIGGVLRSKLLIFTTTLLGALIGVAIALSTPKTYEASTELLVDPRDLKLTTNDLTASGLPSDATLAIVENQARVLTSGTVLNKVVDKLHLDADPEFNGQGGGVSFGIRDIISMIRASLSRGGQTAGGDEAGRRRALAVANLASSLNVARGGKTFVIVISAVTQDGEKSALIANTMTDVFLQTYGEIQSAAAGRAEGELTSRLDELRSGVETAERNVETFKAEHDIVDAQGRLITDDEIVSLNGQLSVARARTLELNAKAQSARGVDVDSVLGSALPEQIASGALTELRSQYATLKQEADRQSVHLGPRHPQRQAIEAQLAGARQQIQAELRRIVSSIQVELKRSVQLEQELASRLAQLKVRNGDLSSEMVTLRELEREATAKRSVYESFLLRAKETGEQKDVNSANMSVISTAYPPLDPNGPSRSTIAVTGLVLGLFSGLGLGVLRGAYEGLRMNMGVAPRRRKWLRWKSPETETVSAPPPRGRYDALAGATPIPAGQPLAPAAIASPAPEPDRAAAASPETSSAPTMDAPMYDPYAPRYAAQQATAPHPQAAPYPPMHPAAYAPQPAYAPQMPPQPVYPAPYAPPQQQVWQGQPYAAPAPYGYPPQPYPAWQQQPAAPYGYPQPMPAMSPPPPYAPQPMPAAQAGIGRDARYADNQSQIDEIRESLREFREAVRDLADSRTRRNF